MIKVVNQNQLCSVVWNYMMMPGHEKYLLVWCQWGTYCKENVQEVIKTHKIDNVTLAVNEDESAEISSFIQHSISERKEGEKLIIISFLPWGREEADAVMEKNSYDFESVRYEVQAGEWLNMNFAVSDLNLPVLGFLKEHPDYFCLPYGEKPMRNAAGPCPETWADVSFTWSDIYSRNNKEWKDMPVKKKLRLLLLSVASCIGNYEPILSAMEDYLIEHKGYDNLLLVEIDNSATEEGGEQPKANFTNLFDEKGNLIWK